MSKLKTLNKETVSFVLLNDLNLPAEVIGEIVEIIWRSDDRLEEIQRANNACTRQGVRTGKKDGSTIEPDTVKSVGQRPAPCG